LEPYNAGSKFAEVSIGHESQTNIAEVHEAENSHGNVFETIRVPGLRGAALTGVGGADVVGPTRAGCQHAAANNDTDVFWFVLV
jgi:hypothetical protein